MPMNLPDFRDKIDKESDLVFLLRMYYVSVLVSTLGNGATMNG